jgi:hypothetical protein
MIWMLKYKNYTSFSYNNKFNKKFNNKSKNSSYSNNKYSKNN